VFPAALPLLLEIAFDQIHRKIAPLTREGAARPVLLLLLAEMP
jgi:hypothetical protein